MHEIINNKLAKSVMIAIRMLMEPSTANNNRETLYHVKHIIKTNKGNKLISNGSYMYDGSNGHFANQAFSEM